MQRRAGQKKAAELGGEREDRALGEIRRNQSPWGPILALLIFIAVVFTLSFNARFILPEPLPKDAPPDQFSEGRAFTYLEYLTKKIGSRVVGSPQNEEQAAAYIQQVLLEIQKLSHPQTNMEIMVQSATGSYFLNYRGFKGFVNVYTNITNIVVRIHRKRVSSQDAILLSCHYDSMTGTEGASDNGAAVAVMLETIRALVVSPPPVNEYVILFNGAEEMGLQGAHGFIEHHHIAKKLRVFINLDSGGCGGRTTLLQTGPGHSWLTEVYNNHAPRRMGSVGSQDVFQSGVVPSDTDFRIFAEFGNIPGLDFVYFKDGFAYHTHLDTLERMPQGSLQFSGDNILAIATALGHDTELGEKASGPPGHSAVYYDILGIIGIVYSWSVAKLINYSAVLLGVAVCRQMLLSPKEKKEDTDAPRVDYDSTRLVLLASSFGMVIGELLLSILFSIFTGVFVSIVLGRQMTFYSAPWVSIILYGSPSIIAILVIQLLYMNDSVLSFSTGTLLHPSEYPGVMLYMGTLLFFMFMNSALTGLGAGLSYIPMLWTVYLSIVIIFLSKQKPKRGHDKPVHVLHVEKEFTVLLGLGFLPSILTFDMFESFYGFIVPITGRAGPIPADIVVSGLFGFMTALNILPFVPFLHRVLVFTQAQNARKTLKKTIILLVAVVSVLSVVLTIREPFNAAHPKRLLVQETLHLPPNAKSTEDSVQSHLYTIGVDALPPPLINLDEKLFGSVAVFGHDEAPKEELQAVYPLALEIVSSGWKVKSKAPLLTRTRVVKQGEGPGSQPDLRRVSLTLETLDEPGLCTSRYHTLNITSPLEWWSLTQEPPRTPSEDMSDIYFIRRVAGTDDDWEFQVELKKSEPLRICFTATYFCQTPPVKAVSDDFPDWVTLTTWTSVMESYEF